MHKLFRSCLLFVFLLCACNFPRLEQPPSELDIVPSATPVRPTDTPAQELDNTACGFVWAREPLTDISGELDEALKEALPEVSGRAEAYGENCINNQGEVVRFLAMETDFHVTLQVRDLEDRQAMGEMIEQVLTVLLEFPIEATPGPQPGYVGISFEAPGDQLRLWFRQIDAETALESGLHGEELLDALQAK